MAGNHALLLVEDAIPVEELDLDELTDKLAEAEARLESADEGTAAYERAERDVERWTTYRDIATS
jgi:F0F1-type ATP synthase epsilon subunit